MRAAIVLFLYATALLFPFSQQQYDKAVRDCIASYHIRLHDQQQSKDTGPYAELDRQARDAHIKRFCERSSLLHIST